MFLHETLPGVEVTASGFTIERRIPDAVRARLRGERIICTHCKGEIAKGVTVVYRGGASYHPSCADRTRAAATVIAPTPQVIGRLSGVAVTLDRDARVTTKTGPLRERFASGAFHESIRDGGQTLKVNHSGFALRGRYLSIAERDNELRFRFELHDGIRERDILARVGREKIRFCSIAFVPHHESNLVRDGALRYLRMELNEISLIDGGCPAWPDT
ncbi:MAG TPA: HK97 family phage prohead protease, partial [Chthoniobacteraceae bacterium]|nr:HK97 family phage prohead protease [Chthoniobacteraceae bacterium]